MDIDNEKKAEFDIIWQDDRLLRKKDAEYVVRFLLNRIEELREYGNNSSYVLNIDAKWGSGKTFFLQRLRKHLACSGHPAIYVNAWEDDFAEDPLISIMSTIDHELQPWLKSRKALSKAWGVAWHSGLKIAGALAMGAGKRMITHYTGDALDNIKQIIDGPSADEETKTSITADAATGLADGIDSILDEYSSELLSKFRISKSSANNFKNNLSLFMKIMEKNKKMNAPLFILIDELDRCRPYYAVSLLERVKHLFNIDNVVFVIATDTEQLRHSINSLYGVGFDSGAYLRRFFNRRYLLSQPNTKEFVEDLIQSRLIDLEKLNFPFGTDPVKFFVDASVFFSLSLRDLDQCMDILRTVITTWPFGKLKIQMVPMFLMIAAFQNGQDALDIPGRHLMGYVKQIYSSGKPWSFSGYNHTRQNTELNVNELLGDLQTMLSQSLDISTQTGDRLPTFAQSVAIDELKTRFPGGLHIRPLTSVIREYPSLIQNAGRFQGSV